MNADLFIIFDKNVLPLIAKRSWRLYFVESKTMIVEYIPQGAQKDKIDEVASSISKITADASTAIGKKAREFAPALTVTRWLTKLKCVFKSSQAF